jgi:hypothetical protein
MSSNSTAFPLEAKEKNNYVQVNLHLFLTPAGTIKQNFVVQPEAQFRHSLIKKN